MIVIFTLPIFKNSEHFTQNNMWLGGGDRVGICENETISLHTWMHRHTHTHTQC